MSEEKKRQRKLTRSVRLKKYEHVFKEYIRHKSPSPKKVVSRRKCEQVQEEKKEKKEKSEKRDKKSLNSYQLFVKEESGKNKYKNMSAEKRMKKIVESWNSKKKGRRKKT